MALLIFIVSAFHGAAMIPLWMEWENALRTAIIDGDRRFTYSEFADRSRRLAGGLAARGIARVITGGQNTNAKIKRERGRHGGQPPCGRPSQSHKRPTG